VRKAQWRVILEKLSWLEAYFEILHVRFAVPVSEYSKAQDAVVVMPWIGCPRHPISFDELRALPANSPTLFDR
jgi:hypothetical protein